MNILLTIAYDGTNYSGWQKQNNVSTIQAEIELALSLLFKRGVGVQGASRTDSGVHAKGQCATFQTFPHDPKIPIIKLPLIINSYLPLDIRVVLATVVSEDFHPIGNAIRKKYEYKISSKKILDPFTRFFSEHISAELNFEKMQAAIPYFMGEHDFKAFCATGGSAKTSIRTVYSIALTKKENMITLQIEGNGFLYNMVRIIAGTLIDVGRGKIPPENIASIIDSLDRSTAGKTAPAKGLTLLEIYYDK